MPLNKYQFVAWSLFTLIFAASWYVAGLLTGAYKFFILGVAGNALQVILIAWRLASQRKEAEQSHD